MPELAAGTHQTDIFTIRHKVDKGHAQNINFLACTSQPCLANLEQVESLHHKVSKGRNMLTQQATGSEVMMEWD
jgi:hypothetical protein